MHKTVGEVFTQSKQVQQEIGSYVHELGKQSQLWDKALKSLGNTVEFLSSVETSLAGSLNSFGAMQDNYVVNKSTVDELLHELSVMAASDGLKSFNSQKHEQVLGSFLKQHAELEAIYSNFSDGSFIYSQPPAGLANARARDWWKSAMSGEEYRSEVYISAITRQPCLTLAVSIPDDKGKPAGVLAVDLCIQK
jgi:hypothetical protein